MEFSNAATLADAREQVVISIRLEAGESLAVGDEINIEMIDETHIIRKILSIRQWHLLENSKRGKWITVDSIEGNCCGEVTVEHVPSGRIQTTSMPSHKERKRLRSMICLTPYKEIHGGKLSIYDFVEVGYTVPDKVIAYLKTTKPFVMSPGIYDHPFIKGKRLLGPYKYTDDIYYWDRDTWKYVVKYGLKLEEKFIDHVMSDEGTKFIEEYIDNSESWSNTIKQWKKDGGFLCFLPDDAGNNELEEF